MKQQKYFVAQVGKSWRAWVVSLRDGNRAEERSRPPVHGCTEPEQLLGDLST